MFSWSIHETISVPRQFYNASTDQIVWTKRSDAESFFDIDIPAERADSALVAFGEDATLMAFGGYRTDGTNSTILSFAEYTQPDADPELMMSRNYMNDLWIYDSIMDQWRELKGETALWPPRRKGHTLITRTSPSGEKQLIMFGGSHQDVPFGDMYSMRTNRSTYAWTRLDESVIGLRPTGMAYHTMVWMPEGTFSEDGIVVFGGLQWRETDLVETDKMRNNDRRCFKVFSPSH